VIAMKIDPQRKDPWPLRVAGAATAFGIICVLFVLMVWRLLGSDERVIRYFDLITDQVDKSLERESVRYERERKAQDERLREAIKAIGEQNRIEHEKTRLEIRNLKGNEPDPM
jgi:hypothetical protein